jgi:hypothetical protein
LGVVGIPVASGFAAWIRVSNKRPRRAREQISKYTSFAKNAMLTTGGNRAQVFVSVMCVHETMWENQRENGAGRLKWRCQPLPDLPTYSLCLNLMGYLSIGLILTIRLVL